MLETLWTQLVATHPIDWLAMPAGVSGVWLSIQERISAWPCFILCYLAYIYISFRSGYYAFGAMNLIFVGIAAYGWGKWFGLISNHSHALKISHLPVKYWCFVAMYLIVSTFAIGALLTKTGEARLPYMDAFATSCAFTAQWLLSRKHIENWIFWIISDFIYIGFFLNDKIWPSVLLFGIFIVLAVKGWRDWKQSMYRNRVESSG